MADNLRAPTAQQPARRRATIGWILIVALCCAIPALIYGPLLVQGVPVGNQNVTYRPPHGPASPALLDSRPDIIARQYLADYIRLAGTYPCESNPNPYFETTDLFLRTGTCDLIHPVASVTITSVSIEAGGLLNHAKARVYFTVNYQDGSQWQGEIELTPYQSQGPWPFSTHLTCWANYGTLVTFGRRTPDIPPGAQYWVGDALNSVYCKP